jgi:hypothetical protein
LTKFLPEENPESELAGAPMIYFRGKKTTLVTLANSTLTILFSEMLKFSKKYFLQIKKYCEGK